MFTGIVEEKGLVRRLERNAIEVAARLVLEGTAVGHSVNTAGVCLTVTGLGPDWFRAEVMEETLARTRLGRLNHKDEVNLERAMPADGRLGGHMLTGHVDCVGRVSAASAAAGGRRLRVEYPAGFRGLVVEKGSIALDGVSLTVAECGREWLSVALTSLTARETTLGEARAGTLLNLEFDVLGKYALAGRREKEGKDIMQLLQEGGFADA